MSWGKLQLPSTLVRMQYRPACNSASAPISIGWLPLLFDFYHISCRYFNCHRPFWLVFLKASKLLINMKKPSPLAQGRIPTSTYVKVMSAALALIYLGAFRTGAILKCSVCVSPAGSYLFKSAAEEWTFVFLYWHPKHNKTSDVGTSHRGPYMMQRPDFCLLHPRKGLVVENLQHTQLHDLH